MKLPKLFIANKLAFTAMFIATLMIASNIYGWGNRQQKNTTKQGKQLGQPERPSFAKYDTNSDGVLNAEEFRIGQAKRVTKMAQEGRAMKNAANRLTFKDVDINNDGRITQKEFETAVAKHRNQK